jgi:group I intron endonuclease
MKYSWLVYRAVNSVNGKFYIGHTRNLERRKSAHHNDARSGSRFPFHAAIRKHGWESFEFSVLTWFATETEAKAAERRIIAVSGAQDRSIGYNVADGGDGIGSAGAKTVHRRPLFRKTFLASMPVRHARAQATKKAGGINRLAGIKAAATKRARGIDKLAGIKAAETKAARLAPDGDRGACSPPRQPLGRTSDTTHPQ